MTIALLGIDLAKTVFALHGHDAAGHTALQHLAVPRARLVETVASLPPCTVAMESCSGAHHWARTFAQHDHTVKLIAPKFVTPFRITIRRSKTDAADAVYALAPRSPAAR